LPDAATRVEMMIELPDDHHVEVASIRRGQGLADRTAVAIALGQLADSNEATDMLAAGGKLHVGLFQEGGSLPDEYLPSIEEVRRRQAAGEPLLQMRDLPGWTD
jgi:hypothetical protein